MIASGRRRAAIAFAPLLAAPALLAAAMLAGFTGASAAGTPADDVLHGFFLDRYPLFACVIAYGVARLLAVAALEPGRWRPARGLTAPLAVAALLAASLHPTFGGLVLRAGFMTGGVAFQEGAPLLAAHAIGAGVAALAFGAVLGGGVALVRLRLRSGWRPILRGLLAWAALWLAFVLLVLPRALGLDPLDGWPRHALTLRAALTGAGLAAAVLLPHALLVLRSGGGGPGPAGSREGGSPSPAA